MPSQDEVEEFAALLGGLKARTDRSYGALARRLDMNTSTLHRYCAGETVPSGFASVERFAALCGATPAERVELHRSWVLAVAARQRRAGDRASTRAATAPGTVTPASGTVTPASRSVPSSAGKAGPVAAGPAPAAAEPAALRPSAAKGWYGRRPAVCGVALAVLCSTLGALAALSSDGATTTAAGGEPGPAATAPAAGRPGPTAPADGRSSGGPPASSSAASRVSGAGPDPTGPSALPSARPSAATVAPLAWSVDSQPWATGCDHDYVIDKAPRDVPPPPAPQDAAPWARSQRAVHGGRTLVGVSVQGRTDTAVVLEALRVRVVGRADPVGGAVYSTGQGCGSDVTPRSFAVDLDKDRPLARPVPGSDRGTDTPAVSMPYKVSATDPEVLLVDARTADCDCRWYLELDWSSQGRTGTARVDDHGVPFRTSGTAGLPRYWYANRGWTPW